jgi:hypothetical protein
LPAVAGAFLFFIRRGEPGSEDAMIDALKEFGDRQMASAFQNCGNAKLEKAANAWRPLRNRPELHSASGWPKEDNHAVWGRTI